MKRIILAAVLIAGLNPAMAATGDGTSTPYVCVVVRQLGVVRSKNADETRGGMTFPCYMTDDQAIYAYDHSQLDEQKDWYWHGFNPSNGKIE